MSIVCSAASGEVSGHVQLLCVVFHAPAHDQHPAGTVTGQGLRTGDSRGPTCGQAPLPVAKQARAVAGGVTVAFVRTKATGSPDAALRQQHRQVHCVGTLQLHTERAASVAQRGISRERGGPLSLAAMGVMIPWGAR